jgi:DNA (cytosine-5)-methyltransferase 1
MKILNLYSCLGGNRYKWTPNGDEHEITAVELDPDLARMYKDRFPNDIVIVSDAQQYLLEHYKEFDFIWSSPPCPSHSRVRFAQANSNRKNYDPIYPDMTLYQEIIFLDNYFKGKYVVENVIPFYEPLIPAQKRDRHLYWCNFKLPNILSLRKSIIGSGNDEFKKLCKFHEIDLSSYKGNQRKDKIVRNLVDFEAGRTILNTAMAIIQKLNTEQTSLF